MSNKQLPIESGYIDNFHAQQWEYDLKQWLN